MDVYAQAKQKHSPIDDGVNDGSQILVELLHQDRNCGSCAKSRPPREHNEHCRRDECHGLFPSWPIEGIIRVVGGLRHEDHVGVFFALKAMRC